jgi:PhzF family phenazine biosynthesis protein
MRIPIYQVDAFTSRVFAGNPAAVCPLDKWLPDQILQSIAAENNLAETAFFVRTGDRYHIRWLTPAVEVDLCGHATLASAWVLFNKLGHPGNSVTFDSKGGPLSVSRDGDLLTLDFPSRPPQAVEASDELVAALGGDPLEFYAARDTLAVYPSEEAVRALTPDFGRLARSGAWAVIATATGRDCDFVSRFFAPAQGIDEDPVTGSAHCTLTPFWAHRYGKNRLTAKQVSRRGGELACELAGDRVKIAGQAVLFLEGAITIPDAG